MLDLILGLALFALPPSIPESGRPELELERLATPATTRSAFPNLARGADDQVYLSWVERKEEGLGVMRVSVLGKEGWGEAREVVRGQNLFLNWADFPSVCALENGVLIAHWLRQGEDPHGYNAEFSLSADAGRTWSAAKLLHTDLAAVEHGFVSIVPIDEETFGAIWLDGRASVGKAHGEGETALYFRTIKANGDLGKEAVLDERVCDCCPTSLIAGVGGELFATYRDRSETEVRDISMVRHNGKTWSKPKRVHADEWIIDGCPVNGPRVADEKSGSAVAWFTGMGGGGGSVLLAFSDKANDGYGTPIDIDEGRPVGRVDVVFPTPDSALVSWLEYAGEGKADWRVRLVARDGKKGNSIKVGEVPSDRSSGYLRMVTTENATILAWTQPGPDGQIETARLQLRK